MSEIKTVTVGGNIYQVGALYMDSAGMYCVLLDHYTQGFTVRQPHLNTEYDTPSLSQVGDLYGTIEKAPLALNDGEWYMCHWEVQVASETCEHFNAPLLRSFGDFKDRPERALLFKPLYKMVRAND